MNKSFGLIGGGWRAEFLLRVARDLPEQFPLAGVLVRDPEKRKALADRWRVPVFATIDDLFHGTDPAFVVTSVPWAANLPVLELLAERNIPALSETPVAPEIPDLHRVFSLVQSGARIQVAEQYLFQPLHAARLNLIASGRIGAVTDATVSIAHGYHGLSLLRRYLGSELRLPVITASKFQSRLVNGPGRGGPPAEHTTKTSEKVVAHLDFGDLLGIYDFVSDQYFSWIRSPHLLVRGETGEINQNTVRYLHDFRTPAQYDFIRRDTGQDGNLEGHCLESILGGGEILYRNPFPGMRWSDDEIAVATSLSKMQRYAATGETFYDVAEACQDRYLDLLVEEAIASGVKVAAQTQPWTPRAI